MANTATRLITLLMLLQRQPNQKASELAAKLGISVRSLHRYVGMLDEMGIPVYSERGPYGGFSLVRGYKMPPLVFNPEEAVAVYLGASLVHEMWGRLYAEAAQGALAKLDNVLPEEQRIEIAWARKSLVTTGLHRSHLDLLTPLLEKLRRAARERRCVTMTYQGGSAHKLHERQVDPYALVYRWGWWYVYGYCHLRRALRSFRVDRIAEVTLLDKTFEIPEGFDIHAHVAKGFESATQVRVVLRYAPEAAHIALENRAYCDSVEEQPDGSMVVAMTTPDLQWAASAAISFGPIVTVLEPQELCEMVRDWACAVAAKYDQPHGRKPAERVPARRKDKQP
jgi:predicted DNA-binding transcriptional regulator YafY